MPTLRSLVSATAPAAVLCVAAGAADAQSLCQSYTVQRGDNLSAIATRANVSGGYRAVFDANRGILRSPNVIRVGQDLSIPCADGSLPAGASASTGGRANGVVQVINATSEVKIITLTNEPAMIIRLDSAPATTVQVSAGTAQTISVTPAPSAPAPATTTVAAAEPAPVQPAAPAAAQPAAATTAPAAAPVTIKFVTGTFPPWSGEDLPEQGFFTELIKKSLEASGANFDFTVTFVEDWDSHLDVLLPSMAYDMTYPWALPDCTKVANLDEANARRCTDFDASDAFISAPTGFYTLKGSPLATATEFNAFRGKRLCRPDGHFTFDLQGEQLTPPNVILMQPQTPAECWLALLEGNVDVVTYSVLSAEEDMMSAGLGEQFVATPLETVQSTHVFVSKENPRSAEFRDALDRGLAAIRANGQWFEIVSRHLSEREARLSQGASN